MLDINKKSLEKVIIVGLIKKADDFNQAIEYLDELEFLVKTAGGIVIRRITQKMRVPNPKTFIGSGTITKQYISIGNNCIIGSGVSLKHDVESNQVIKN